MACERERRYEPVTRIEYDLVENVVRAMNASPHDAYWPRRLVDLVKDPVTALRLGSHLVTAIARWAAHDPSFFVHERHLSEQLAVWAWPRRALEELDATLALEDPSLTHLVLGRLWLSARRPAEDIPEFCARAAGHLREVDETLRVGAWHEAICEALSVADPDELARIAGDLLDRAPPLARDRALVAILRGAARAARWDLYDAHRRAYGLFETQPAPPSPVDSEIVRLDDQRATHRFLTPSMLSPRPLSPPSSPRAPSNEGVTVIPGSRGRGSSCSGRLGG